MEICHNTREEFCHPMSSWYIIYLYDLCPSTNGRSALTVNGFPSYCLFMAFCWRHEEGSISWRPSCFTPQCFFFVPALSKFRSHAQSLSCTWLHTSSLRWLVNTICCWCSYCFALSCIPQSNWCELTLDATCSSCLSQQHPVWHPYGDLCWSSIVSASHLVCAFMLFQCDLPKLAIYVPVVGPCEVLCGHLWLCMDQKEIYWTFAKDRICLMIYLYTNTKSCQMVFSSMVTCDETTEICFCPAHLSLADFQMK